MQRGDYLDEVRLLQSSLAQIQHGRKRFLHEFLALATMIGGLFHTRTPRVALLKSFSPNFSAAIAFGQSPICAHFYRAPCNFTGHSRA
jgi:hypothetical protein